MTTENPSPESVDVLAVMIRAANLLQPSRFLENSAAGDELVLAAGAVASLLSRNAELEAERDKLELLCDATYVQQGADAYHHACEVLEAWQEARFVAGKDRGCEGSLCDGLSWLQSQVTKLEDERDAVVAENNGLRETLAIVKANAFKTAPLPGYPATGAQWLIGFATDNGALSFDQVFDNAIALARTPAATGDQHE
jgi:hypothetical protein